MQAFGYTMETMDFMLLPLIHEKRDPVGSMGNDSALACLSDQPRMLYDYFKQLFAQVTNPAIDSIREEIIMSLECYIGPELNLLETTPQHAHRLRVPHPIITNEELAAIKHMDHRGWRAKTIDISFPRSEGAAGMLPALDRICDEAESAIDEGFSIVVLSDRQISADRVPVSSLLACGAVHHHLVKRAKRTRLGIVLESGEAREVHHHCLLVGYGADAINPYLAFESLWQARREGLLDVHEFDNDPKIVSAYRKGVAKGMLKVMAKMGISTLQSYKGAQIFEAVGLRSDVIERSFVGTPSRVKPESASMNWRLNLCAGTRLAIPNGTKIDSRRCRTRESFTGDPQGERHTWDPQAIADIQVAARTNSGDAYARFAEHGQRTTRGRVARCAGCLEVQGNRQQYSARRSRAGQ